MYHHCAFKSLQNHSNQSIQIAKQNYVNKIAQRLGDSNTSSKCYWSLLKTLLNGKKIPTFLLYFMVINILLTFKKNMRFSILFSLLIFSDFKQKRLAFWITIVDRWHIICLSLCKRVDSSWGELNMWWFNL